MKNRKRITVILLLCLIVCGAGLLREVSPKRNGSVSCTLSVNCLTAIENESLKAETKNILPPDGAIADRLTVDIEEGCSALDVLQKVCREKSVHLDFEKSTVYGAFIKGIGNLYNGDCGELSGWLFVVNGELPSESCGSYQAEDGDEIEFLYSCDMGADLGLGF